MCAFVAIHKSTFNTTHGTKIVDLQIYLLFIKDRRKQNENFKPNFEN